MENGVLQCPDAHAPLCTTQTEAFAVGCGGCWSVSFSPMRRWDYPSVHPLVCKAAKASLNLYRPLPNPVPHSCARIDSLCVPVASPAAFSSAHTAAPASRGICQVPTDPPPIPSLSHIRTDVSVSPSRMVPSALGQTALRATKGPCPSKGYCVGIRLGVEGCQGVLVHSCSFRPILSAKLDRRWSLWCTHVPISPCWPIGIAKCSYPVGLTHF